jgi:hypothetical protein
MRGLLATNARRILAALVVLVLIIVVFVAVYAAQWLVHSSSAFGNMRFRRAKISTACDRMKTGDLILMISYFAFGTATGSLFTHAGMVVRSGNDLYLSESVPSKRSGGGSRLVPLLPRLKHYAGHTYWVPLAAPLTAAERARIERAARAWRPYPTRCELALGALGLLPEGNRSLHCFQHVSALLDCSGCAPKKYAPMSDLGAVEITRAIAWISGEPLANGNRYEAPRSILFDIDSE